MPNKEFLETYPLLKKFKYDVPSYLSGIDTPAIHIHCKKCRSDQTYNMNNSFTENYSCVYESSKGKIVRLVYECTSCHKNRAIFFIMLDVKLEYVQKIGQYPPWQIDINKNLEKMLGKHATSFKNGLVCESQSYGIGAFAYYRRIVEDIMDELLDSIIGLIPEQNRLQYEKALAATKKTNVAQEKIALVKDLLPSILRPDGHNPLSVLHKQLSKGLHAESDEECLEVAGSIREILTFLVNRIIQTKESAKSFTTGMKKILDKKAQTPAK